MNSLLYIVSFCFISASMVQAQVARTVVVEHFTNTRCGICAAKNPDLYNTLSDYPDVLHIAYHPSAPYASCIFSEHNPVDNDARTNMYGIYGATPRVVLQGDVIVSSTPLLNESRIDAEIGEFSPISIEVNQSIESNNTISVDVILSGVDAHTYNTLNLFVAAIEESVAYNAPNGESLHHDVFRLPLTENQGSTTSVPPQNQQITIQYSYLLSNDWMPSEMYAIAILADENSNEIIQAGRSEKVGNITHIADVQNQSDQALYPNPTSDYIYIPIDKKTENSIIEIYDVSGKRIDILEDYKAPPSNHEIQIPIHRYKPGVYQIKITSQNKTKMHSFIKK